MMKLKEQTSPWPPVAEGKGASADLGDIVLRAFRRQGETRGIDLRLQTREGLQYEVLLPIPENLLYKATFAIVIMQGNTLRDIGELEL
jgi:hypothetical protein